MTRNRACVAAMLGLMAGLSGMARADEAAPAAEAPAAGVPSSSKPAPSILKADQAEIDLGEVLRGDPVRSTFVLKNPGTIAVSIEARPTCGCTAAKFDKTIPPGGEGKLETELNTASLRGRVRKPITVTTDEPGRPTLTLTLVANVLSLVEVEPGPGKVVLLRAGEPAVEQFTVRTRGPEPIEVTAVRCTAPYTTATFEPAGAKATCTPAKPEVKPGVGEKPGPGGSAAAGPAYCVRLTIDPAAPFGQSTLTLSITTSSKREPTVVVPVVCEKGIVAMPPSVLFNGVPAGTKTAQLRTVMLRRREGPFRIVKIEDQGCRVEVREESMQNGSLHRVTITYRGGDPAEPQEKIRLETDDPLQPWVEIPVRYSKPSPPRP